MSLWSRIKNWWNENFKRYAPLNRQGFTNTESQDSTSLDGAARFIEGLLQSAGLDGNAVGANKFGRNADKYRHRNSQKWIQRIRGRLSSIFRRHIYNNELHPITGRSQRCITDPSNGETYLIEPRFDSFLGVPVRLIPFWKSGRFLHSSMRRYCDRATAQDISGSIWVSPDGGSSTLREQLDSNGVFVGASIWDYRRQIGQMASDNEGWMLSVHVPS
ncbi:MAG: hypothetical protein ACRDPW_03735, partial [Mycobacteriales bacterium]